MTAPYIPPKAGEPYVPTEADIRLIRGLRNPGSPGNFSHEEYREVHRVIARFLLPLMEKARDDAAIWIAISPGTRMLRFPVVNDDGSGGGEVTLDVPEGATKVRIPDDLCARIRAGQKGMPGGAYRED